ncbi:hypothetical protein ACTFIR_003773 [Dictyostelium discoideum]
MSSETSTVKPIAAMTFGRAIFRFILIRPLAKNKTAREGTIPWFLNLTLEELKAFHEEHYTLSNCLFFFYGDIPLGKYPEYLENNLFSTYKLKGVTKIAPIPM